MTKVDVFSGFLGAGKTTLIKKLIAEAYQGEKLVLIENEFGEIGIDSGFLQDAGIEVTEMNAGCICCTLVGDFSKALREVLARYAPDRILIEPSGVSKLSELLAAVRGLGEQELFLNACVTVADAKKCKLYSRNFGEFYNNQIAYASTLILSRSEELPPQKLEETLSLLRERNALASIITTPWATLSGAQILEAMEGRRSLSSELSELAQQSQQHQHGHDCCCGHAHEQHKHDHDHDHEHNCSCAHESPHHVGNCSCGHAHDADEVFSSWGRETTQRFDRKQLASALLRLDSGDFGTILRAKGIVQGEGSTWLHFDYVPGEASVREGAAGVIGRLCVIGSQLKEPALAALFEKA